MIEFADGILLGAVLAILCLVPFTESAAMSVIVALLVAVTICVIAVYMDSGGDHFHFS